IYNRTVSRQYHSDRLNYVRKFNSFNVSFGDIVEINKLVNDSTCYGSLCQYSIHYHIVVPSYWSESKFQMLLFTAISWGSSEVNQPRIVPFKKLLMVLFCLVLELTGERLSFGLNLEW